MNGRRPSSAEWRVHTTLIMKHIPNRQLPDAQLPPQWPAESSRTFSQKWLTWTVNTRMVFMCDVPTVDECVPSFVLIKWWTRTLMANRVTEANFHRQITKSFSIKIDSPSASRMHRHTLRLVHPLTCSPATTRSTELSTKTVKFISTAITSCSVVPV